MKRFKVKARIQGTTSYCNKVVPARNAAHAWTVFLRLFPEQEFCEAKVVKFQ